jgi:hypothetical protein
VTDKRRSGNRDCSVAQGQQYEAVSYSTTAKPEYEIAVVSVRIIVINVLNMFAGWRVLERNPQGQCVFGRAPRYKKFWNISLLSFLFVFFRETRRAPRKKFWNIFLLGFLFVFSARQEGLRGTNFEIFSYSIFCLFFPRHKKSSEVQILKHFPTRFSVYFFRETRGAPRYKKFLKH